MCLIPLNDIFLDFETSQLLSFISALHAPKYFLALYIGRALTLASYVMSLSRHPTDCYHQRPRCLRSKRI